MYRFIDNNGTFELENADRNSYLYFPICNDAGIMGSLTPTLGGDLMLDKNRFILEPTSVENLHNNRNARNFWLRFEDGVLRSATGNSVWQKAERDEETGSGTTVRAGLLWHEVENTITHGSDRIKAEILDFAPVESFKCEIMRVRLTNTGDKNVSFTPVSVIPLYARSADNLRDHRHVTSLLHRIETAANGVTVTPTLSFDERGHLKNHTTYFVVGCDGSGKAPAAFYPTVGHIISEGGDFERPLGLKAGNNVPAGERFEGVEAVGGLEFEMKELAPGASFEYIIFIGADDNASEKIPEILKNYGSTGLTKEALDRNISHWTRLSKEGLSKCKGSAETIAKAAGLELSDAENYLLWVSAEPVLRRIFGCSFLPYHDYGKGGRGWRDLWQDCLALMLGDPKSVRDLLINNFAGVRADGTNATIIGKEPGEFVADRNGIARVWMDHGVWTWITMKLYTDLSGDTDILETEQVYFKDRLAMRARDVDDESNDVHGGKKCFDDKKTETLLKDSTGRIYRGSLFEHMLLMHLTVACDVGENGNMLLRGADWNDALDMADKKGESVAFTAAYAGNLKEMAGYLRKRGGKVSILKEIADLAAGLSELCKKETEQPLKDSKERIKAFAREKQALLKGYCQSVRHDVSGVKCEIDAILLADELDAVSAAFSKHIKENEFIYDGEYGWINGYYDNEGKAVESLEDGRIMLTGAVFSIMSGIASESDVEKMIKTADKYLFSEVSGGYRLNTRFGNEEYYAHNLGRMFGFAYGTKENGAVFCHMAVMYAYALLTRGFKEAALKVVAQLVKQSMTFAGSRIYPGIPEYFDPKGRGMYPYLTGAASWLLLFFYKIAQENVTE